MPETNQKEFNGAILISENKDYSAYSPGDATHPLQPIAVSPSSENISNSLGKAARWIEVIDEKADKAGNLSASSGINIYGDGSTGNPKKITNTGVNSVENTTVADTSATNGDIRIVNKTVNPSTGVVSDSVSYVKPKGINDPAFKALDSSTSGLTSDDNHVPTSKTVQDAIDTALASASVYKGTIAAFNDLPTSTASVIVRKGWYYRVSTAWAAATGTPATHVGDIIIAEIDSPSKAIDSTNWSLLHNEANTDANVTQSPVSTNANYEVLFSGSADNTSHTEGTGKDSGLTYNPSTSKLTISGEVSASSYSGLPEGNTTTKGIVQLGTDADKAASGSHGHGNITNDGAITASGVDLASGDALVFADSSDSSKLKKTSITFDGSSDTQALTKKGTWETFNNYTHPTDPGNKHIPANGATGNYLKYGGSSGTAAWTAPLTSWPATAAHTDTLPSTKLIDDRFKNNETNILYSTRTGAQNLIECINIERLKQLNNFSSWTWEGNVYKSGSASFTVNGDGSITVNGTFNGQTFFYLNDDTKLKDTARFKGLATSRLWGCPEGGSDTTYFLTLRRISPDNYWSDLGSGIDVGTIDATYNIQIFIEIRANTTVSNKTFYPSFTLKSIYDQDSSYCLGALPNTDLTRLMTPFFTVPINHNMIYRGQNLGETFTDAQHTALSSGNFTDLYLGDYWTKTVTIPAFYELTTAEPSEWSTNYTSYYTKSGDTYTPVSGDTAPTWEANTYYERLVPAQTVTLKAVIADFDTFYTGYASTYAGINTHHAAVIVTGFSNVVWNKTNSTAGGYVASLIHKWLVGSALPQIETWFGSAKVLSHQKLLTNAITGDAASGWAWSSQKISLLSENQMYGSKVWGNSKASNGGYEPGEAFKHLNVFNHIDANLLFGNKNIWLRDIASAVGVACLGDSGYAVHSVASATWIAPAALILLS